MRCPYCVQHRLQASISLDIPEYRCASCGCTLTACLPSQDHEHKVIPRTTTWTSPFLLRFAAKVGVVLANVSASASTLAPTSKSGSFKVALTSLLRSSSHACTVATSSLHAASTTERGSSVDFFLRMPPFPTQTVAKIKIDGAVLIFLEKKLEYE